MKIEVFNPNNPGAKFTSNTENTLVAYYHELENKKDSIVNFSELRVYMQKTHGINNSNSRNIFAFCKNCGLLEYESGQGVTFETFFTNLGKAYVKVIESISMLSTEKNKSEEEKESLKKFYELRQNVIFQCLKNLLKQENCEYVDVLMKILNFLLISHSIDKTEYALLLCSDLSSVEFDSILKKYRNNQISIDVFVNVRNDDSSIKGERVLKDIGFLTSWSYLIGMLAEAGLVEKENQSYFLLKNKRSLVEEIVGGNL